MQEVSRPSLLVTSDRMNSYTYSCTVPFHLSDPAGILFFGHAFTLFHQGFEHFVTEHLKCPWKEWFQNPLWFVPIKHAEAEYMLPVHAGQECHLDMKLASFSNSSMTMQSVLRQKEVCCLIKTVHVFCDKKAQKKIAIPENVLSSLRKV